MRPQRCARGIVMELCGVRCHVFSLCETLFVKTSLISLLFSALQLGLLLQEWHKCAKHRAG